MLASCAAANACRISHGLGQARRSSVRPVWRTGEYVSGARHKCGWERESRRDEVRPHGSSEQPYAFLLGDFELNRRPVFFWITMALDLTRPLIATSSTFRAVRSQARSLLSIARLNIARSRIRSFS